LRLIGVTASHFADPDAGQGTLFADPEEVRERELDQVMDHVNERFGKVLRRGGPPRDPRR
jgi:hypothetical protein